MIKHILPNVACLGKVLAVLVGLATGFMIAVWSLENEPDSGEHRPHRHHNPAAVWTTNHTVADHMRQEIRILCWIMTGPANHQTKAQHVRHTWGRHCNTLLFMSSAEDLELPGVIPLVVDEGRDNLWPKTKKAFQYIYEHHRDDADWFLKADDDSYVVMENLRTMLHPYPVDMPIFFGRKFMLGSLIPVQGYMSGGASYVLSKEAMRRFVERGIDDARYCFQGHDSPEDVELGNCMERLDVVAGDSRDTNHRERFFPLFPAYHLEEHNDRDTFWYYNYSFYAPIDGPTAVAPSVVSFHYISPRWMYLMDYLIYGVRTFGRGQVPMPIDERKLTMDEVKRDLAAKRPDRDFSKKPWIAEYLEYVRVFLKTDIH